MKINELLYLTNTPFRLGGEDPIWHKAFSIYNYDHEEKIRPLCHSHYKKVQRYVFDKFNFSPGYYKPGPSGLSQAAKDEMRQIIKEEIGKLYAPKVRLPEDSIRFR